jgi:hypothetical protein
VPYRVGRESRATFGEPHAGHIYVRFKDYNPLPGSTGEADDGIQAFCFRFHLTKDKANSVPVEKPAAFNRDDYRHVLAQIAEGKITRFNQVIQLYEMPNGKFEVNSDHPHHDTGVPAESLDLAEENWRWPEAGPAERERIFARYWSHNEGLVWLLQNDSAVPQAIRDEASQWGFPKDEFTDHRHRPHHIYVRQGRRIWGEYTLTQNDAKPIFDTGLPARFADGIAVTEFEFDSHAVRKYDLSIRCCVQATSSSRMIPSSSRIASWCRSVSMACSSPWHVPRATSAIKPCAWSLSSWPWVKPAASRRSMRKTQAAAFAVSM